MRRRLTTAAGQLPQPQHHPHHHHHSHVRLVKNVTLLGPPGSGKGFYGRPLAQHFHAPLLTASAILRDSGCDTGTGRLLEDHLVARTLHRYIEHHLGNHHHYFLDGFPRTTEQIRLMEEQWPIRHQAHLCLHLAVPDDVCRAKMLGRRHCATCGASHNVAHVRSGPFDLPPQPPPPAEDRADCANCSGAREWTTRADDTPGVIDHWLEQYRIHEREILNYYRQEGRLLQFTPHKGEKDIPRLCWTLEQWLERN